MTSRAILMLSLGLIAGAGSARAGTWNSLPPLSPERFAAAAAATHDALFVMGGMDAAGNLGGSNVWNSGGSSWSTAPALPASRSYAGAAPVGTAVLLVGGFEDSGFPSTAARRFDSAAGTWSDAASMPAGRAAMACALLNDAVLVAGGEGDFGALMAQSLRYDPVGNSWSAIADLPTPRTGVAGGALNGRFFVVGGANGPPLATVEQFDPGANAWSAGTDMPEALWMPAAATFAGRLWVMGGFDASFNASAHVYSMGTDGSWRAETPLPEPLAQAAAAVLGDQLIVAGGVNSLGQPTGAAYAMSAEAPPPPPPPETLHVAVTINPATLNTSSQGQWISVLIASDWLIADLDIASVTLAGVPVDLGGPLTINQDPHQIQVKFPRDPFTRLSPGTHVLPLAGLARNDSVAVRGSATLMVVGGDDALHPHARLKPVASGTSQTAVTVELDRPTSVKMDVLDVQGRVVDHVENAFRPAGSYSVVWPASGQRVRSGLYIVHLRAGETRVTTRLVVSR